jgi:hypothetical protein
MANNDRDAVWQNNWEHIPGDCYRPIPKDGDPKVFMPPQGGTGARTIQVKPVGGKTEAKNT